MKKRLQNPMVITNVYFLGKGEVVSSNLTSSTIPLKILSFIFRTLRRFIVQILSCIFAVLLVLWCIGYALQMQFMDIRAKELTRYEHVSKEILVWTHR